jgi:hypothetical protein
MNLKSHETQANKLNLYFLFLPFLYVDKSVEFVCAMAEEV